MPNTGYAVAVSQKVIGSNFDDWRNCSGSPIWEAPIRQTLAVLCRLHSQQNEDSQPVVVCYHNFFEEG